MVKEENPFSDKINGKFHIPCEKRETTRSSTYKLHIKNMEMMFASSLL